MLDFTGIQAGIENTNYAVSTTQGEFILTIFEVLRAKELHCILDLVKHLSANDFPAPVPQMSKQGVFLNTFEDKPAALFKRLSGSSVTLPSIEQCEQIGIQLARLHQYGKEFRFPRQNPKDLAGFQSVFQEIRPKLTKDDIVLLDSELNFQFSCTLPNLPQGIIHADLFMDNVLFHQGRISGILDFYNACTGYFLFDIAVTANDWCVEKGAFNRQKFLSLLLGYQKIRVLNEDEKQYLAVFLRLAALRFYLSRLQHQLNPKAGDLTLEKDPLVFSRILQYHRANKMELIP